MKKYILPILIVCFVLFSFVPTFYELGRSADLPGNRSFELIHNYITDYNFYLSRIREGWDGRTTLLEIYTNEPHHGTIIHELYLVLGRMARFISNAAVAVPYAYHAARFVFGLFLLSLIARVATRLIHTPFWQVLAFLVVVTSAGYPNVSLVGNSWRFNNFMPWWTVLEPLQRLTFVPHILLAQCGLLFLIIFGSDPDTLGKKGNWIFLSIIAMGTGLVMPQALMMVYGVFIIETLFEFIFWQGKKDTQHISEWMKHSVYPRMGIVLLSVWTILYFLPLLRVYPWKRLVDFETLHPIAFSYIEYLKTLGFSLPLGIIGGFFVLKQKDRAWYPIVAWALGVVGLVFAMTIVPLQHPLRFTEMAAYIPLGLLTAYFFHQLILKISNSRLPARQVKFQIRVMRQYAIMFVYSLCFLSIVYGCIAMYHQFLWQKDFTDQKVAAGWPVIAMDNYIVYPSKDFIDGILYIDASTPKNAVILSAIVAGNYIPARTGRVVYLGHENTSYKEEKVEIVKQFYSGLMEQKACYLWLHKEGISYVFWGPQEHEVGGEADIAAKYPFLREVYKNTEVTVYQVTP